MYNKADGVMAYRDGGLIAAGVIIERWRERSSNMLS